jgi:hypothetical protein
MTVMISISKSLDHQRKKNDFELNKNNHFQNLKCSCSQILELGHIFKLVVKKGRDYFTYAFVMVSPAI